MRGTSTSRIWRFPASNTSLDDVPLVGGQGLVPGDQVPQLLARSSPRGRPSGRRRAAARPGWSTGTAARPPAVASTAIRSSTGAAISATALLALQGQPLRRELAETRLKNEMTSVTTISDTGSPRRPGQAGAAPRLQVGRPAVAAPNAPDSSVATVTPIWTDGQEPVGVLSQLGRPLAALAAPGQRADLTLAERNQGHLGGGEEAPDKNYDQDKDDVPADAIHVWIPSLSIGERPVYAAP